MSDKYPGGFVTANAPAGFSVAFDGTANSYLTAPDNTAFDLGSGDFVVECWVYLTATTDYGVLLGQWGIPRGYALRQRAGKIAFVYSTNGTNETELSSTTSYALNTWYYVAAVRTSNTLGLFINSTREASASMSGVTINNSTDVFSVGRAGNAADYTTGYISNARIIKGTVPTGYSATATSMNTPTQLFPVTNTSILTCQSPTIIDNSTNAFTITAGSTTKVSNFTPFAGYTGFNPALGAAAGGVWTLDEAAYYQNNRQWPIYDPYFKNTTLMLHGNGTNAAQNNTFLDSSTNNFTITRNGNTTQGSFTPFSQTGWSNYFDGSSSIQVPSATYLQLSTATVFTFEAWIYPLSLPADAAGIIGKRSGGTIEWQFFLKSTGQIGVYPVNSGASIYSGTAVALNTWTHVAFSWDTKTARFFINGVLTSSTTTFTMDSSGSTAPVSIGATNPSSERFTGYISNARVVKGTAVYTSSFTPPTTPLTAVANTSLLSCQTNSFLDTSAYNQAFTTVGTPSVQAFSPFVPAYITPTTYSNYVGTTASYLTVTSQPLINVADWTVEFWMYPTQFNNNGGVFGASNGGGTNPKLYFYCSSTNLQLTYYSGGFTTILTNPTPTLNKWTYVSVSRSSSTGNAYLYYDGILQQTATAAAITGITSGFTLFSDGEGSSSAFYGNMSNARVSNIARYTGSNYTPPSAPSLNSANTTLLTCQSSTFIDNSSNVYTITPTGSVKAVTSPTPFPANVDTTTLNSAYSTRLIGGAAYFDGSGDYLTVASNTAFSWGTGDFSMETWFYSQTSGLLRLFDSDSAQGFLFFQNVNYTFGFYGGNGTFYESANNAITPFAWNHLVVTGVGGTLRLFVNGVLVLYSAAGGSSTASARTCGINGVGTQPATGYMANVRLVKGGIPTLYSTTSTSVGTGVFVPPITPFTGSEALTGGAVSLLTNFTNGAIFDNTAKNILETVGNAQISTTQSKWGGSSMYFDGSGDYLQVQSNVAPANFNMGTGDYTVEFWMYSGTPGSQQCLFDFRNADVAGQGIAINYRTDRTLAVYMQADRITSSALTANTWTHVAVVRASGTYRLYVNGVSASGTWANSDVVVPPANRPIIGAVNNGTQEFLGYIDDLRVTKGVARYLTNFTPPTSQLQDQ